MSTLNTFAIAMVIVNSIRCYDLKEPLVTTKYGPVRGSVYFSRNHQTYHAFRGIPYAKPPVGEMRFRAPERPSAWHFPWDARSDGPICIQKQYFMDPKPVVKGQEDCLYLNVYVPQRHRTINLIPVMVFIHYGGFFSGQGTSDVLGADYFMDEDVVLVTFNYRLGVMGFLSTLDDHSPGNYAFKDQVAALHWVHENINAFGGDPKQVTLFGQSAGAGSVHLHMLSPLSRGLFHGAICESGTALNLWAKPLNEIQRNVTALQAQLVNCGHALGNNKELIQCLRKVDAHTLVDSGDAFKYFSIEPVTVYGPVVEIETASNRRPFLTKQPYEYIVNNEFAHIPWIVGVVQDEGILRASPLLRQSETRAILNDKFNEIVPQMMGLALSTTNISSLWTEITNYFFQGESGIDIDDPESIQGFVDLYSSRAFTYGTYQSIFLHNRVGHSPIWVYNFNYRGQYSYGDVFAVTNETIDYDWGVSHCDDLLYLFTSKYFPQLQTGTDKCLSEKMIKLWTSFASFGHPDPTHKLLWHSIRENIDHSNLNHLNIEGSSSSNTLDFQMKDQFHSKHMHFWSNQMVYENLIIPNSI